MDARIFVEVAVALVVSSIAGAIAFFSRLTYAGTGRWLVARLDVLRPIGELATISNDGSALPRALDAWARCAIVPIMGDDEWIASPPGEAAVMLARWWRIANGNDAFARVQGLLATPCSAWDRVRAIHVAIAANRAGYVTRDYTRSAVLHACRELQARYPSFDAIAWEYLASRRRWAQLPEDGSADDAQQQRSVARVAAFQQRGWDAVPFHLFLCA
ncbi:DUF1266 domain-containing protein [Sandaracinus amylolyticus]|uniref:DUF1266 domain-containing protein n=1 Tax=Sandaracinus amylolyticus TaxID=927083 RepID=UPI001F19EA09|nr:DUF1266 domain-containing protein [Sandaracinus amylolyticus]UJR85393.1 Hypothetical protein I5071_74730 [Sandaracinus amylolyticus]